MGAGVLGVYEEMALRPEATGVRMVEGYWARRRWTRSGWAAARLPGLRPATEAEYPGGWGLWARLPLIDMPAHLPYLRDRLTAAGGTVETRAVADLAEADAPVVVNCTGLAARELVPDPAVRPVRGQLVVVENPGIRTWMVTEGADGSMAYFFPQPGRLLLGGTAEEDVVRPAGPGDGGGDRAALRGAAPGDREGPCAGAPGGAAARPGRGAS